jgi:hypothetical protein
MDGTRFDDLTRVLAGTVSRRIALKASLAALLARGLPTATSARQETCPIFDACDPDGVSRCIVLEGTEGECVCAFRPMAKSAICDRPICASDAACTHGQFCAVGWCSDGLGRCHSGCESQGGVGSCGDETILCGGRCVDLATDMFNCGACGHQCGFGGDQIGEICVQGQCVCPPEYTGSCGQAYCTNEQIDGSNCGACGNACGAGRLCCGGRCVGRTDAERFCEFCGYLGGWPQDCLANEICDRGVCVASEAEPAPSDDQDVSGPTGDLAYSVKNGDHWDIWVYSFDTLQNTQLTSEPNSDQWAPAYSHGGTQLAYLSDQTDGSNQIWLMDPDGGNKRQITDWHGAESILYVAWSPDDAQLIVTLSGDGRRLAAMAAAGGELSGLVASSSSFASTAPGGAMVYASEGNSATMFFFGYFDDLSNAAVFDIGDAPNISPDGHYAAVQQGDPGSRSIVTFGLVMGSPPLPVVPRQGDDSNPVWLTTENDHLAFVTSDPAGETIQVCALGTGGITSIEIAPHDRVWYLSKRFGGIGAAPSAQAAAPTSESTSTSSQPATSELTGTVRFWILGCPGAATELSILGPGIAVDPGPPCELLDGPEELTIVGENGYQNTISMPATIELPLGHYEATHVASGATLSFDLVPTEDYLNRCTGASECIYQWWVTLSTDLNAVESDSGANALSAGTGSIEVHVADCAPGYAGPDFYAACHDMGDGDAHWNVIITGPGDFYEILDTYVESSPGPVVARIDGLPPGTYGVELMTKFVKAPAYVFCSPDQGATVLADQMLADYHDPVQVPVNGNAVVCDWYHLDLD